MPDYPDPAGLSGPCQTLLNHTLNNYSRILPHLIPGSGAVTDDPDDFPGGFQHHHLFSLMRWDFDVGKQIADFFAALHAERDEAVAGFPFAEREGELQF